MNYKKLKLSKSQLLELAEIARDLGQVTFAGLVIAPIATKQSDPIFITLGLISSFSLWYADLAITKRFKK